MGSACKIIVLKQISRKQFLCAATCRRIINGFTQRSLHKDCTVESITWRASVERELTGIDIAMREEDASIYKIPASIRRAEPLAFKPSIISIGPYHHGDGRLQAMEQIKRQVFGLAVLNREILDSAMDAVESSEGRARRCYADEIGLSRDQFLKMMLIDGCFIVDLLISQWRAKEPQYFRRWMLPSLRRDLIMLENQLPLFVLQKLFQVFIEKRNVNFGTQLEELALGFFWPLLRGDSDAYSRTIPTNPSEKCVHLLDLFRNSIVPCDQIPRGNQIRMIRSVSELKSAGVKIEVATELRPLDIKCENRMLLWKKLRIPPLYLDDRRGTLYRNMVAFEKCHYKGCRNFPDVTAYLFFFDGLINSAEDVELLHYNDALHHSFGSDGEVAEFVNNICREIGRDASQSYLYDVVEEANSFCRRFYCKGRAKLARYYFSSWVVGISTLGAVLALYLTVVQATTGIVAAGKDLGNKGFFYYLTHPFLVPFGKNAIPSDNSSPPVEELI